MRHWIPIYILLTSLTSAWAETQDTLSARQTRQEIETYRQETIDRSLMPSVYFDRQRHSTCDVTLRGRYDSDGIYMQRGKTNWDIRFGSEAYVRRNISVLWGNASYTNGRTEDMVWNENSDIDKIYPYLTADTIGGDMKSERYAFGGGYAGRKGLWTWGGHLGYTAKIEYRDIDPRPKNITSDLEFAIGASYGESRMADIAIAIERYKQSNDIEFLNDKGASKIYHLTGLSQHYTRFAGSYDETFYDGREIKLTIGTHTATREGLECHAGYAHNSLEKVLTASGSNDLTIASLKDYALEVEAHYVRNNIGAGLSHNQMKRDGRDHIYGEATSGIYNQITKYTNYILRESETDVRAYYETEKYGIKAHVNYARHKETKEIEAEEIKTSAIGEGIDIYGQIVGKKVTFRLDANVGHATNTDKKLSLGATSGERQELVRLVESNYAIMSSDKTTCGVEATLMTDISKYAMTIKIGWQREKYRQNDDTNRGAITMTFTF